MYRQGLGDCFLVSLARASSGPFHMLIDCGVVHGSPDAEAMMNRVARDIAATTGGHLDVVVVSHEHWDHVSGFLQARGVFDGMTIGEVWLPWTEDPADVQAEALQAGRRQGLRALRVVTGRLAGHDAQAARRIRGVIGFCGTSSGPSPCDAIDYLVRHPSRPRVRYHGPGGPPLALAGLDGARVHVLGPPRDRASLQAIGGADASAPTSMRRAMSEIAGGLSLLGAADNPLADDESPDEPGQAFAARYRLSPGQAHGLPFFRTNYLHTRDAWRRIGSDWLGTVEPLALAMDRYANNASLVLALELEPGGPVLLFPGDAQAENWDSWAHYQWPPSPTSVTPVTAADLLRRTVLYKVAHHASDNATPRASGLDLMTSPELVALISVSRTTAEERGWNMPFPPPGTAPSEDPGQGARGRS